MQTSQYPTEDRRQLKLDQRTPAYRELQRRTAEERKRLELALRTRNVVIDRLAKRLIESGVPPAEVAALAA